MKNSHLIHRLLLVAAAAAGLQALWDAYQSSMVIAMLDAVILLWLLGLMLLNKVSRQSFVPFIILASIAAILLVTGSLIPQENGLHLLFLPLLCAVFILFDYKQHWEKIVGGGFVLGCYLLLEATNFRLFGDLPMLEAPDRVSFSVNFLSSGVGLFTIFSFLTRANYKAQEHLQEMADEAQRKNNELIKVNEELDRFVYSTSHDLRAPLLSVLGLVQLLEKKPVDETQQSYLKMMRTRISNLEAFINDITSYARNARLPLQPEPLQLQELVDEVFNSHLFLHENNPIALIQQIDFREILSVDRQRLNTVLNNLISNAIKYHQLQHPQPHVTVGASLQGKELHLWVADNGPGISPNVQARMFEMFYRGNERSGGSGLGLYIVKEAIEKLGGRLEVESVYGEGSTFHVWVPVQIVEQQPIQHLPLADG
ncbi:integral membrane sensor signal transduction histidine kinase [Flammeovirgaceae bacterium 311]|nr:integral membrane sensor signal transduction histidine kinase [Flammeovirgaceae bacterium 311]